MLGPEMEVERGQGVSKETDGAVAGKAYDC
jgi:hypothetical protein